MAQYLGNKSLGKFLRSEMKKGKRKANANKVKAILFPRLIKKKGKKV